MQNAVSRSGARNSATSLGGDHIDASLFDFYLRDYVAERCAYRPVCRSVSEAADREYSYVLLATKSLPERIKTSEVLAPLLDRAYVEKYKDPVYVILQNGLNVEEELYGALIRASIGKPNIIGTALWIDANLFEGNIVEQNLVVCSSHRLSTLG